jgi:hypothetical protein
MFGFRFFSLGKKFFAFFLSAHGAESDVLGNLFVHRSLHGGPGLRVFLLAGVWAGVGED